MKSILFNYWAIGLMSRVFANGPGDHDSIPGQAIPKTEKKMVLDATLLDTHFIGIYFLFNTESFRSPEYDGRHIFGERSETTSTESTKMV